MKSEQNVINISDEDIEFIRAIAGLPCSPKPDTKQALYWLVKGIELNNNVQAAQT